MMLARDSVLGLSGDDIYSTTDVCVLMNYLYRC